MSYQRPLADLSFALCMDEPQFVAKIHSELEDQHLLVGQIRSRLCVAVSQQQE